MIAKSFTPTPEQLRASSPDHSVWVTANAGSGKTHVLVERIMRLLLQGAEPASILCITYTKAAAAEMSARLFDRLGRWTSLSDGVLGDSIAKLGEDGKDPTLLSRARRLFTQALETPGGLKIQTIHAFCERLLHLFPVEAGMAPGFSVMDERQTRALQERVTRDVLHDAEGGAETALSRSFSKLAEILNAEQFQQLIADFVNDISALGEAVLSLEKDGYEILLQQGLALSHLTAEACRKQLAIFDRSRYFVIAKQLQLTAPHRRIDVAEKLRSFLAHDDPVELLLNFYLTEKREKPRADFISTATAKLYPETKDFFEAEKARVFDLFQKCNTFEVINRSADAFVLAKAILTATQHEKRRLGLYDFSDLTARAAHLLSSVRATSWVLYKLDQGLSHILVDEAQDTSPAQWQIVSALAEEFFAGAGRPNTKGRSLFVVGDQKQSIFSFQGADALGFFNARADLSSRAAGSLKDVELSISYRSTKAVLEAVNRVFPASALQHLGILFENSNEREHVEQRKGEPGVVELWPLVEADDDDDAQKDAWTKPVDRPPQSSPHRKLAREIATRIADWLYHAPRKLSAKQRAIRPDDILILFQNRSELYRMVLAELRKANVPVAGADRLILLKSLIVQDLVMLLHWVLLPRDDHALAVILKSPLVPKPLDDEAVFDLCYGRGEKSLIDLLNDENLDYLKNLQGLAATAGPFAVLSDVLNFSRYAITARLGSEALEASNGMLDLALDYERDFGVSIFGFLRWFTATETTLKRDMDKGLGEVRVMTVHGAKGLEANVVIIAEATRDPTRKKNKPKVIGIPPEVYGGHLPVWKPSGIETYVAQLQDWLDLDRRRELEEHNRLLYVAMTRAADELYVCGLKTKNKIPEHSWWNTITSKLGGPEHDTPLRFGVEVEAAETVANAGSKGPQIEAWMKVPALREALPRRFAMTELAQDRSYYDPQAAKRGRSLHRLLQDLGNVESSARLALAQARALRLELSPKDVERLVGLFETPELQVFLGPGSLGEVDVMGTLADGREVSGRLDRLAVRPQGIWLLDYKTDHSVPETLSNSHSYVRQMALYQALLAEAYPGLPVQAALLWTQTSRLQLLPDPLIRAALQEFERTAS